MLFYKYNCPPRKSVSHPPTRLHTHTHTHAHKHTHTDTQIHIHTHTDTDRQTHTHTPLVISPVMVFILYLLEVVMSVVNIMQLPSTQNIILHNANGSSYITFRLL